MTIGAAWIYTGDGVLKKSFSGQNWTDYDFTVDVDPSESGEFWYISSFRMRNLRFDNIPGYLSAGPDELLVPGWVYDELHE